MMGFLRAVISTQVFRASPTVCQYIPITSLPSVASISVSAHLSGGPGSALSELCEPDDVRILTSVVY